MSVMYSASSWLCGSCFIQSYSDVDISFLLTTIYAIYGMGVFQADCVSNRAAVGFTTIEAIDFVIYAGTYVSGVLQYHLLYPIGFFSEPEPQGENVIEKGEWCRKWCFNVVFVARLLPPPPHSSDQRVCHARTDFRKKGGYFSYGRREFTKSRKSFKL